MHSHICKFTLISKKINVLLRQLTHCWIRVQFQKLVEVVLDVHAVLEVQDDTNHGLDGGGVGAGELGGKEGAHGVVIDSAFWVGFHLREERLEPFYFVGANC